jgi:hypothetical protein
MQASVSLLDDNGPKGKHFHHVSTFKYEVKHVKLQIPGCNRSLAIVMLTVSESLLSHGEIIPV